MSPFSGEALPLGPADLDAAAFALGCDVAAVQAVLMVETGGEGGFLPDGSGRPRILFEAEIFSRLTGGQYDAAHPRISSPVANQTLYEGGALEYDRLAEAVQLDRSAALQATSWGLFQVLGENHGICGFSDVESFVAAMAHGEGEQLAAFTSYCKNAGDGLPAALAAHDWATFARGYNGPGYAANGYDVRLAAAYARATGAAPVDLSIGDCGLPVQRLQAALIVASGIDLAVDGRFGPATERAVVQFQASHGLTQDGIAGTATLAALDVVLASDPSA